MNSRDLSARLKSPLLGTLASETAAFVIGVAAGTLAARLLLPEGRGALAAVVFWPHIFGAVGLVSLNEAITYRIGIHPQRAAVIRASSLFLALSLAIITATVGCLLMPLLLSGGRSELVPLARAYTILFTPFSFVTFSVLAADQGQFYFWRFNGLRMLIALTYLIGLIAVWVTEGASVTIVALASCASFVVPGSVGALIELNRLRIRPSIKEMRALIHVAVRFHPATLLLILASHADKFLILTLWDNAVLGHYVVAVAAASSGLAVVSGGFHKVLFPQVARASSPAAAAASISRRIRHATLLIAVLSLAMLTFMPWLLPRLFGPAFRDAVTVAQVLVVGFGFVALTTLLIQALRGFGEARAGSIAAAMRLVGFSFLALPLASLLGVVGVAAAVAASNAAAVGYLAYQVSRRCGIRLYDLCGFNSRTGRKVWAAVWPALRYRLGQHGDRCCLYVRPRKLD